VQAQDPAPATDLVGAYDALLAAFDSTDDGAIIVHRSGDRLFLEVPQALLDRDMLWHSESVRLPVEVTSYSGNILASGVVQWSRRDDMVDLHNFTEGLTRRGIGIDIRVDPVHPIQRAVDATTLAPIIASFPVLGVGPDGSVVIDATDFITADIPEFSAVPHLSNAGFALLDVDDQRSFVTEAAAFPNNINIRALQTFSTEGAPGPINGQTVSIEIGHSIVVLPEDPMEPRWYDPRVGYFATTYTDYDPATDVGDVSRDLVLRFRLEPQNPDAEISDPVQPIVFYIGRDVPERWVNSVRAGIMAWQPVFEAAGFSNAILAQRAPAESEDPDWAPEDARHSVIRWVAQPFANAMGQNVHDPRSGEVLSAHILVWPDVLKWAQIEYLMLASALDSQRVVLPLPEPVIGELLKDIITHEVGHTFGLRHNFRAASAYTIDMLRNPVLADQYGPTASIMSYGRQNCVAQPGDGISDPSQRISPYDEFAIAWGYRHLPDAQSASQAAEMLDAWVDEQLDNPWLAFGGEEATFDFDPTVGIESIGQDRIEATRLCAANMQRALSTAADATAQSDITLDEVYQAMLRQHVLWLMEANRIVGGMVEDRSTPEPGMPVFLPPEANEQRRAVAYVLGEGLNQLDAFLDPNLVLRLGPTGHVELVNHLQRQVFEDLLSGTTLSQLYMQSILTPHRAYPVAEFVQEIAQAVWAELAQPQPQISPLRRALQRVWLERMVELLEVEETVQAQLGGSTSFGTEQRIEAELFATGSDSGYDEAALLTLIEVRQVMLEVFETVDDPPTRSHLASMIGRLNTFVGPPAPPHQGAEQSDG
jgi:uncharacterized membrane protein